MSKLFNVFAAILLIVGSCFVVSDSHAKVCFLGENCGSGGNFGNHNNIKPEDMCPSKDGYETKAECLAKFGMYMPQYCPFSSKYGICCSLENKHSACIYPLEKSGNACGGKYKCVCDRDTYKYTVDKCKKIDGSAGKNKAIPGGAACAEEVLNSDGNGFDIDTYYTECRCDRALYPYTPDMCDKTATVPQDGICTAIDANGNKSMYYASCYCDRQEYQYTAAGCYPFVGDENGPKCSSGGTTYFKNCKSCDGYPAENLDNVGYKGAAPAKDAYEACPYAQTSGYYKILRCDNPGYRVSVDGDEDPDNPGETLEAGEKCVPISCEDAIKLFIAEDTTYALFNSNGKLVDASGKEIASGTKTAIVGSDTPITVTKASSNLSETVTTTKYKEERICTAVECRVYTYGDEIYNAKCEGSGCQCRNANNCYCGGGECWSYVQPGYGHQCCSTYASGGSSQCHYNNGNSQYGTIVCTSYYPNYIQYTEQSTKYTYRGLNNARATTYYSGAYLGTYLKRTGDGFLAMQRSCKKNPTIKYDTTSNFPVSSDSSSDISTPPTMSFYGVNLEFSKTTKAVRDILMRNALLTVSGNLTTDKSVDLKRETSYANSVNANVLVKGTWLVKGGFTSTNYEFNPRSLVNYDTGHMVFQTNAQGKNLGSIYLDGGQSYRMYETMLIPTSGSSCPASKCTTNWNSTLYFYGPTGGTRANVYTNASIGYAYKNGTSYNIYSTGGYLFGKNMKIKLSRYLNWNLYDPSDSSKSYNVYLSTGSELWASDNGTGNYSRIVRGDGAYLKKFYMDSSWKVALYDGINCGDYMQNKTADKDPRSDQNLVCKIDKNLSISKYRGDNDAYLQEDDGAAAYDPDGDGDIGLWAVWLYDRCDADKNVGDRPLGEWNGCGYKQTRNDGLTVGPLLHYETGL